MCYVITHHNKMLRIITRKQSKYEKQHLNRRDSSETYARTLYGTHASIQVRFFACNLPYLIMDHVADKQIFRR